MLSRRGVRIKVMQMLYAFNADKSLSEKEVRVSYKSSVQKTYDLYQLALYSILKICQIAQEDGENRQTKYLPTDFDKLFTSKLYDNPIIQNLTKQDGLYRTAERLNFKGLATIDFARKLYSEFSKEEAYIQYVSNKSSELKEDLAILLDLFRFCRKSEYFIDVMEDGFSNWVDDKSLVIGAIKKTLKMNPDVSDVLSAYLPDSEIVDEFGAELLQYYLENEEELLDLIKPILENWDHERLANIDVILIKMALAEFLHFPTIPIKVSINEYVEVSKLYSTPKSKEFINGILDKLYKKLEKEDRLNKQGRGLEE